jgi:hypothetical protein
VSFASLDAPAVDGLIDRFAAAGQVSLVVGAGASMEALLPSWPALLERLLLRVARDHADLTTEELRAAWVQRTLGQEDLLAAGAVVEVMASTDLDTLLPEELFGPAGAGGFEPGPIAHQVAHLRQIYDDRLAILTTNYDDLIERALLTRDYAKRDIRSYVRRRETPPAGTVPVTHLHGYAGRDGPPKKLVLTEEHYHRMQRGTSWQEQYVTERLETSLCLFVGTSLADPNLIRYLYGYRQSGARRHAAVFVRQGDLDGAVDAVRTVREEAARRRWGRCGVEAIFVDHFGDAAQLLYEIGLKRRQGSDYERLAKRASVAIGRIGHQALLLNGSDQEFGNRQVALSRWLRETLQRTLHSALGADPPADERLALALWLLSADGTQLTGWAHSDRAHQDPETIEAIPITPNSSWVSVRTVCQGVRVELDRHSEVSRWRFIRGLPLYIEDPTRLPIGCLTISSTRPSAESILATMSAEAKAALHRGLVDAVQGPLSRVAGV